MLAWLWFSSPFRRLVLRIIDSLRCHIIEGSLVIVMTDHDAGNVTGRGRSPKNGGLCTKINCSPSNSTRKELDSAWSHTGCLVHRPKLTMLFRKPGSVSAAPMQVR